MFRKTAFPLSRYRKFLGKRCVAALDGVFGVVLSVADVVFVRDTGYSLEKGVSLHGCSGKQRFPFHDTGDFAENGVSRRVRGEEGRERKGSGSGWDGRAVECRMETAHGLWHGSGVAEKRGT